MKFSALLCCTEVVVILVSFTDFNSFKTLRTSLVTRNIDELFNRTVIIDNSSHPFNRFMINFPNIILHDIGENWLFYGNENKDIDTILISKIVEINCRYRLSSDIEDDIFYLRFHRLHTLVCNELLTDQALCLIGDTTNLRTLKCEGNRRFTDSGLLHVSKLTYLDCGMNVNFTDNGLRALKELTYVDIGYNINFTFEAMSSLVSLRTMQFYHRRNEDVHDLPYKISQLYKNVRLWFSPNKIGFLVLYLSSRIQEE